MSSRFADVEPQNVSQVIDDYLLCKLVSLDEAVSPIAHIVPNVLSQVITAKDACQLPMNKLTPDESAAIYLYTMDTRFYIEINKALRKNVLVHVKPWFLYLKLFHTALNKLPSQKERVWRGIKGNVKNYYVKGTRLIWTGISSTSTDIEVIRGFLPDNKHTTVFSVDCLYGKSIVNHSAIPNEQEIILMPGTILVIKGILPSSSYDIIDLKEVINPNAKNNLTKLPAIKPSVKKVDPSPLSPKVAPLIIPKVVLPTIKPLESKEAVEDNCK